MARIVETANQITSPRWAGDFGSPELGLMRGGFRLDAAQWQNVDHTIVAAAEELTGSTAIVVDPLPVAIPAGTFLNFEGTIVHVTASAAAGAESLTVDATEGDIAIDDEATYTVNDAAPVTVPSGTAVGRTLAERDADDDFGPADASDDEIYLIYFEVADATINPDFVAYRPYAGRIVKENYLPGFADLAAGVVTALRARYQLIVGA